MKIFEVKVSVTCGYEELAGSSMFFFKKEDAISSLKKDFSEMESRLRGEEKEITISPYKEAPENGCGRVGGASIETEIDDYWWAIYERDVN